MTASAHLCPMHDVVVTLGETADRAKIRREHGYAGWRWVLHRSIAGPGPGILEIEVGGGARRGREPIDRRMGQVSVTVHRCHCAPIETREQLRVPGQQAHR